MIPASIRIAYVDSSAVVTVARDEPNSEFIEQRLSGFQRLVSSNLLEAEVNAAYAREGRELDTSVGQISSMLPTPSTRLAACRVWLSLRWILGSRL